MWFPYDADRWPGMHEAGIGRSGDVPRQAAGAAPGPGDETAVSAWEAASIVLGLAVLSGAAAAVVVSALVLVIALLVVADADARSTERSPGTPPPAR